MCARRRRRRRQRSRTLHPHHEQSDDHGDVANGVNGEAPALANLCDEDSGYSRPYYPRPVKHGRVERDGIHQILFADHVHEERLAARNVERVDYAKQRRQHENLPNPH